LALFAIDFELSLGGFSWTDHASWGTYVSQVPVIRSHLKNFWIRRHAVWIHAYNFLGLDPPLVAKMVNGWLICKSRINNVVHVRKTDNSY